MMRLAAMLFGLGCALVVSELGLRLSWAPPMLRSTPYQTEHALYGSALIPGAEGRIATVEYEHPFHVTAQGLRGRTVFAHEPAPGVRKRVLFLGDSFTFGLGSADDATFVGRLAERWTDVEVANGGANGYGTREALAVLDRFGAAFEPDLTVLVFFWNDLEDIVRHDTLQFAVDEAGRFERTAPVYDGEGEDDPLALRSGPRLEPTEESGSYLGWFLKYGLRGLRYRYFGIKERSIQTEEQKEAAWQVFEPLLELMRLRAAELDTRLVVVAMPDHNQVDEDAGIKNITALNFDVQERLASICAELDLPFIDLLPALKARWRPGGAPLYYYADRHLTPEGNRIVAELLATELERFLTN